MPRAAKRPLVLNATSTPNGVKVLLPRGQNQETSPNMRNNNIDDTLPILDDSTSRDDSQITQRELDQVKDALNAKIIKQQKDMETLERKYEDLKVLVMEIYAREEQNKVKEKDRKLPPALSTHVHLAYDGLSVDTIWNFNESYRSKHNKEIKMKVYNSLRTSKVDYEEKLTFRAIYRYFENLKRQEKEGPDTKTTKRRTTRRHRLFLARDKVEKEGDDAELWQHACANVMSDEETDDEGPTTTHVFRRHDWRTDAFNDLIDRIDASVLQISRNYGTPSTRKFQIAKLPAALVR
ncbi:uncharacterized protein [Clytia hemisphaerica]|uniref:Uncharacterized protein n=1 Tax=Clytia hemisphaerica TaxID=252671 RepID=A0A7M5UTF6_9CNID|eukprot:TCONS_00036298-protein